MNIKLLFEAACTYHGCKSSSFDLIADQNFVQQLPIEIIDTLRFGSNKQYLGTLARLVLQPSYISAVFSSHEVLSVELCSRWLSSPDIVTHAISIVAALAQILPVAPYRRLPRPSCTACIPIPALLLFRSH